MQDFFPPDLFDCWLHVRQMSTWVEMYTLSRSQLGRRTKVLDRDFSVTSVGVLGLQDFLLHSWGKWAVTRRRWWIPVNTKSYSPSCSNNSENRVTTVHNGSATSCHLYLLQVRRFRGNEFIQPPNVSKRRTFSRFYRPADAASLFRLYTRFDTRNVTEVVVWKFPPAPLAFGELYRLL